MSNIAKELRERSLRAEQEGEPLSLLDDAADEIERLRLTEEEREAIEWSINDQVDGGHQEHPVVKNVIATLRGLLKRVQ